MAVSFTATPNTPPSLYRAVRYTANALLPTPVAVTFIRLAEACFGHLRPSLFSALLYAFMTNLLWFFGVHGTNVLAIRDPACGISSNRADREPAGLPGVPVRGVAMRGVPLPIVLAGAVCLLALLLMGSLLWEHREKKS